MSYRIIDILNEYFELFLKNHELYSTYAKVTKVTDEFCEVEIDGKAPVNKVRLGYKDGDFLVVPEVGSKCVITFISSTEAVLSLVEKINKIVIKAADTIEFNDGKNGGLVKASEISTKLNAIINDINNLKNLLTAAPVSPGDGGATLKASLLPWAQTSLNTTSKSDFENTKIKH